MTRREMIWLGTHTVPQSAADIESEDVIPNSELIDYGRLTVTRMIGSILLRNDTAVENDIAIGVIVVNKDATAATTPNPRGNPEAAWLYRKDFYMGATIGEINGKDDVGHFDVRSQRKIGRDEKLVVVVDDSVGDYQWAADIRVLVKLA